MNIFIKIVFVLGLVASTTAEAKDDQFAANCIQTITAQEDCGVGNCWIGGDTGCCIAGACQEAGEDVTVTGSQDDGTNSGNSNTGNTNTGNEQNNNHNGGGGGGGDVDGSSNDGASYTHDATYTDEIDCNDIYIDCASDCKNAAAAEVFSNSAGYDASIDCFTDTLFSAALTCYKKSRGTNLSVLERQQSYIDYPLTTEEYKRYQLLVMECNGQCMSNRNECYRSQDINSLR